MFLCDMDLRKYLQQNHNKLTWKERIHIVHRIFHAINTIHYGNVVHRDLHSGNILYYENYNEWYVNDLGFCGLVVKPLKSIYGNLPYVAPEAISRNEYTLAS